MMDLLEATQAVTRRLPDDVPVVASLGNPFDDNPDNLQIHSFCHLFL